MPRPRNLQMNCIHSDGYHLNHTLGIRTCEDCGAVHPDDLKTHKAEYGFLNPPLDTHKETEQRPVHVFKPPQDMQDLAVARALAFIKCGHDSLELRVIGGVMGYYEIAY